MRNVRGVWCLGLAVGLAGLGALPSPAPAADPCANAAFRTGAGATLPDCRAYEQVTPRDKSGVGAYPVITTFASRTGDRVFSGATGAMVPTDSASQFRTFTSSRSADWATRGAEIPKPQASSIGSVGTLAVSDDGTKVLSASPYVLAPGGVEGATNLYVRDLTQPDAYTLMASVPGLAFMARLEQVAGPIFDATPDLDTIAISTDVELLPDVPAGNFGQTYIYFAHAGEVTLASRNPDGTPRLADTIGDVPNEEHRLSDDGLTVTWKPQGAATFVRSTRGGGVVDIGRSRIPGGDPAGAVAASPFGSADGSRTLFSAGGALTPESTPGSEAIYRWNADDTLDDLTAGITATTPARNVTIVGASDDGDLVWFTTTSELEPDDGTPQDTRLYVLDADAGTADLAAVFDATLGLEGNRYRLSPDGRRIAIRADTPLANESNTFPGGCKRNATGGLDGSCGQIYTFDARAPEEPVTCVSCLPGPQQVAVARFGDDQKISVGGRINRAITDDGRVFFDTAAPLAARDTDTVPDVYQYTPGAGTTLLSQGGSGARALFSDATPDGASVFFHTGQQLVPQDADNLTDLYVARTNGGIATQQVPPASSAPEECQGDACKPAAAAPPARPVQGSATFSEPAPGVVPRFSLRKPSASTLRRAARRGRLTLPIRVNVAGSLSATLQSRLGKRKLRRVAYQLRRTSEPGTLRLTLKLSTAARRHLRRTGRLSTRLTVAYSERTVRYRTTLTFTTGRTGSGKKGGAR